MLNRVGLALIAAFLMPACATYGVPPGTPATDVLRSAERADWRARVETRDTAREGVVAELTSDSVTVGAARVAVADITSIHRRRDASQFILVGAATGILAGIGTGFVITPWFGPFGYVILGASTGTGIVVGALAARKATEDDWYQVWPPRADHSGGRK